MMLESKEINIKRGKRIGSVIGIIMGVFIAFYIIVNRYDDMLIDYIGNLL